MTGDRGGESLTGVTGLPATAAQRAWAGAALVLAVAALAAGVVAVVDHFPLAIVVVGCVAGGAAMAWWGVRRTRPARQVGLAIAAILVGGSVALAIATGVLIENLLVLAALAAGVEAARRALRIKVRLPAASPPQHPVLVYNPRSGGGKAQRFHLAEEARRRGLTPIALAPGGNLEAVVRSAIAEGAEGLAMAGGDGSQAIVAMIAAEQRLPYACIPAGTRNHFALDLGVDRDDVVGALDAFCNGGERWVDLAEVNGRVFVNNVSLGLYADAVARPGYREAKLHTLFETLPEELGPGAAPPALEWEGPNGRESASVILVSNNPYRLGRALGSGTRPRIDRGVLGVTVLAAGSSGSGNGHRPRMRQWTATEFEIHAAGPVPAGIDGEAVELHPPLRFTIRPAALRVRIAAGHPGASPSAVLPDRPRQMFGSLAALALHGDLASDEAR
jgi:diacylglycerol kinase family enzyme